MTYKKRHRDLIMAVLLCSAAIVKAPAKADDVTAQRDNPTSVWCTTSQPADNGPNDWLKIPEQSIHLVRASMQEKAKASLTNSTIVEMTENGIIPYLRDGETVSQDNHIYLVRAAAFYVNDKYELPKPAFRNLPFNVSYSPSRGMLVVANFALGYAGVSPTNLALAVESPNPISRSEAVCLRTQ
jgi:hypothetical protein